MTDNEIKTHLLGLHRNALRTLARLKAFETVVSENIPLERFKEWEQKIDLAMDRNLQMLLEDVEKTFPGWAAELDNRGPGEMTGVV
jgi:hypothetical protein